MDYRCYKNTQDEISLLGFGAMRLPTAGDDETIDYDAAKAMVDLAIKQGVNYFDTAYGYHGGKSEPFLGRALAEYPRESYHLASKMPMWLVEKEEDVERLFAEQLKRCRTDYFDFYLFHSFGAESYKKVAKFGMWEKFEAWKKQGKIRHIGFSFHDTPEVLETICSEHPWEFAQLQLNYFDWEYQRSGEQYAVLEKHGIPCIVMEPVRGGRLADLGEKANAILKAAAPGRSVASWAFRYAAALPNVMTVLSGMTTLEQVEDNLATFSPLAPFTEKEQAALDEALAIFKAVSLVPCTECRYCMPCPSGVDIPGLFKLANRFAFNSSGDEFREEYLKFPAEAGAANCVACGQCEAVCPQHIEISARMARMDATSRE